MNKKTVLIVAPYFPPHSGGLERYVFEVAHHLNKNEWNIVVVTTSENNRDEVEGHQGSLVHRLRYSFKVSNTPFSFSWFSKIRSLFQEIQPDLVNVHMPVPGIGDIATFLTPKSTPLVLTYHGESMKKNSFIPNVLVWLYEHGPLVYLLRKAKTIICSSDSIRKNFLSRYMEKSKTIFPGVDTTVFAPGKSKSKKPTVLFVAGLNRGDEHKGLSVLLSAIAQARKEVTDIQLTVVGEGDQIKHFRGLAEQLEIDDAVTFKGKLLGEDLIREYQRAHVFALPTKNDSFGMVIAEAMATGLPVVSTSVGDIPQLVDNGVTGALIAPDDVEQLSKEVVRFLKDERRAVKFGIAGREKMMQGYGWSQRARDFEDVYREAGAEKINVAHVVGYYPPHVGGMEVVVKEVALAQAEQGMNVKVFTSNIGAVDAPRVEKTHNCTVRRLRSHELARTPLMWTLFFRLLAVPKKTILHVHLAQVGIPEIALLVSKVRRLPLVFHFHLDVGPSGALGNLFLLYKKYILGSVLRRADSVVVFSEEQKQFLIETYAVAEKRICIIPNGVGSTFFLQKRDNVLHEPLRLLFVGRLAVQKRLERLVRAVGLLPFPAHLTLVGDGEDREMLETLAEEVGQGRVSFEGSKNHQETVEYYRSADIFLMSSDKEGMSISTLEAMATGLPVVGTNVMGIRELVDGVGILVDKPFVEGFVSALCLLHSDRNKLRLLGEQSRAFAEEHTWSSLVLKLQALYEALEES